MWSRHRRGVGELLRAGRPLSRWQGLTELPPSQGQPFQRGPSRNSRRDPEAARHHSRSPAELLCRRPEPPSRSRSQGGIHSAVGRQRDVGMPEAGKRRLAEFNVAAARREAAT
jgi:hypothetical protein